MGFSASQMAQLSTGANISGSVNSAISSYFSAAMQKDNLKYTAAMAELNARVAELGAQSALLQGKSEVAKLTAAAGQLKSRQKVALAANGIDLGVGNAAEIQASTDMMKEIDADTLKANAMRSAWGYRNQAVGFQNQARSARATAKGINPLMSATTSLIGDAGQVAGQWYGLQKEGAFGTTTDTNGNQVNSWW